MDRRRIMQEAREHVVAGRAIERDMVARLLALPIEDRVAKWRREADAREAEDAQGRAARQAEERAIVRERAADAELAEVWIDAIGQALAEVRAGLRAEFAQQIAQLRAELGSKDAAGGIVDLQTLLKKRKDVA
jgi:hypothetical protein